MLFIVVEGVVWGTKVRIVEEGVTVSGVCGEASEVLRVVPPPHAVNRRAKRGIRRHFLIGSTFY